jgi:hypothetical protein
MAKVFREGAEAGDVLFWDGAGASISNEHPRTGTYNYAVWDPGGWPYKNITALSECYYQFSSWIPAGNGDDFTLYGLYNTGTQVFGLVGIENGNLSAYINSSQVAVGTVNFTGNVLHLFEVYVKLAVAGVIQVRIDGSLDINFSGDTSAGGTSVNRVCHGSGSHLGSYPYHHFDDLALNDTTGGVDDSWVGGTHIEKLTPNGVGTTNGWFGSDYDYTDNHLLVDDFPPDSDTTYVVADQSATGLQEQYALSDFTPTNKRILNVWAEARLKKTSDTTTNVKLGLKSGSSDYLSSNIPLTTNYARYTGTVYSTNPADSQDWEDADLDSLEFVAEVG